MKKTITFTIIFLLTIILCSCSSDIDKVYTIYNSKIYYGMHQNDVNDILSESYITKNFDDTISYQVPVSQDFIKIDSLSAISPEVKYKFEDNKLIEIVHIYEFNEKISRETVELYNTYLSYALGVKEAELKNEDTEIDGTVYTLFINSGYYLEDEFVFFIYTNSLIKDTISIYFRKTSI